MGWPILGDSVYGSAPRTGGPGLHLHAREIVVPLYKNRAPIQVTAPVPPHMQERLRACGWSGETLKATNDIDVVWSASLPRMPGTRANARAINTASPSAARARCGRAPGRPSCPG